MIPGGSLARLLAASAKASKGIAINENKNLVLLIWFLLLLYKLLGAKK
jgi:hypothetical protein